MKKLMILVVTFFLFSLFISLTINTMGLHAYAGSNGNFEIPFFDDFAADKGWVDETSGDFKISDGYLNWNADRNKIQKMYLPINSFSGNFQLSFDFQLTHRENNVWLEVGLAQSLTGEYNRKDAPIGTFIQFGWIGGGTPYSVYYVTPLAMYSQQIPDQGGFNWKDPSTYVAFSEDRWYHAMLEVDGLSWTLTVSTKEGQEVGQRTGAFPSPFGAYNYIYIGNRDSEDWPEGNGYLDNLKISKTTPPPPPVCNNLLTNPGFDNQLKGWKQTKGTSMYLPSTIFQAKSKRKSTIGIETTRGNLGRMYQDFTGKLTPGEKYKIGGWIKTRKVKGHVVIALDYVDDEGWSTAKGYVKEIGHVSGKTKWQYFESDWFTLPPMPDDCKKLWFLVDFNIGRGIAWFDDLFLCGPSSK